MQGQIEENDWCQEKQFDHQNFIYNLIDRTIFFYDNNLGQVQMDNPKSFFQINLPY